MNIKKLFVVGILSLLLSNIATGVSATDVEIDVPTPPDFPSCESVDGDGDWVHTGDGFHHIPGQEVAIEGSDDVYQLENQDFLQCLCAIDDSQTTQTVWWNITNAGLTQDQIQSYLNDGWILENGGSWNLIQRNIYLTKNGKYLCAEPTPTITPIPTPGEELARCTGIETNPSEGTAALYVKFAGAGVDYQGEIKEYHWDFGDNSDNQPERINTQNPEATHVYHNSGTYKAKLEVLDSRGVWHGGNSECETEIIVKDEPSPQVAGVATELPSTGVSGPLAALASISLVGLGVKAVKRFRLV